MKKSYLFKLYIKSIWLKITKKLRPERHCYRGDGEWNCEDYVDCRGCGYYHR